MPVVLRKRKAPQPPPEPPAKKQTKVAKTAAKAKAPVAKKAAKPAAKANGTAAAAKSAPNPVVGDIIALEDFGGEVETNDGDKTTLKALVDESKAGVVLFTYPKASTPGCTTQVCLFRDSYADLTAAGLAVYGLSSDSPKANTTFKDKQKLPYPLLCDPAATLISAIGLAKSPRGTTRGVFVVDAAGKVLAAGPGGPARTLDIVKALLPELPGGAEEKAEEEAAEEEEVKEDAGERVNGDAAEEKEKEEEEEEAGGDEAKE